MFNLEVENIFVDLATRSLVFGQGKKAENVCFIPTSGLAVFICLWLLIKFKHLD